jgi:hypothetical protein
MYKSSPIMKEALFLSREGERENKNASTKGGVWIT